MFPIPLPRALILLGLFLQLSACLPGEDEVASRYNDINQRIQIENTGLSLAQTASNHAAYLTAKSLRSKQVLSLDTLNEDDATARDNTSPSLPLGVAVKECSDGFGVIVYFTQEAKGVPPLKSSSNTMQRVLAQRFGSKNVGWHNGTTVVLPKIAQELGCAVANDIISYSPIFVSGFKHAGDGESGAMLLPDPNKATSSKLTRNITIPCPPGYKGTVPREQHCKLKSGDNSEREDVKIKTGEISYPTSQSEPYETAVTRIKKEWECDPPNGATSSPTAEEIASYCRATGDDMEKPADDVVNLNAESLKQILESSGPGYYSYFCRRDSSGSNKCDTSPYTPTIANTYLRCDNTNVPEQYVINPILPVEVDSNGKVLSGTPQAGTNGVIVGTRDCGNGWTGDLIAGYRTRACQLIKKVNGVETPIKLAQTIFQIGYVGARCKAPPKEAPYSCPRPYDGDVILREENYMTKPLALQLQPAAPGEWSKSIIPWSLFGGLLGNANQETRARAASEDYRIARRNLQGVTNPRFTSWLESTMMPDLLKEVTGCKLTEQTCELPPDRIELGIVFDRSSSMLSFGDKPTNLTSATSRMVCRAQIEDIFTDKTAACALLEENAMASDGNTGSTNGSSPPYQFILSRYLIDRTNPTFVKMMNEAVEGKQLCGYTTDDVVGYCKPGGKTRQSSCSPGTCTIPRTSVTGTYLTVAEEQLQVALSFTPPGSTVGYTEFVYDGPPEQKLTFNLCDYVADPNCDFVGDINKLREGVKVHQGVAKAGTPLMEATAQALTQFGSPGPVAGILLYFTDGAEGDGNDQFKADYPYPYGSLCGNKTPASDVNSNGDDDAFCRGIGITENNYKEWNNDAVLQVLQSRYQTSCTDTSTTPLCLNIKKLYDPDAKALVASGIGEEYQWFHLCGRVGTTTRPSVADYIKQNYPNLKVFILNLGSRDLQKCPSDPSSNVQLINVDNPDGYETAFKSAFDQLNTKSANPADVCNRIRRIYANAVDY